ncbi:hypothetical protein D9M71_373810 [compost metagenome]
MLARNLPAVSGGSKQLIAPGINADTQCQSFQHRLVPRVLYQLEKKAGFLIGHTLRVTPEHDPCHAHHDAQQQHDQQQLQQRKALRAALFHSGQLPISASISSPPG